MNWDRFKDLLKSDLARVVGQSKGLCSLTALKSYYVFSKKGIRNSQSNMQTTSISPQNRTKILSLQN